MSTAMTMRWDVQFSAAHNGRKSLGLFQEEEPCPAGRIPRVSRLMALAIKMDGMIRDGVVKDYAELARLGRVSRARISQIMSLTTLAPDIQDAVLHLPRIVKGREPIKIAGLLPITQIPSWVEQRKAWEDLTGKPFPMPDIVVRKMLHYQAVGGPGPVPAPALGGVFPAAPAVLLPLPKH